MVRSAVLDLNRVEPAKGRAPAKQFYAELGFKINRNDIPLPSRSS
jgi:hypothetical protein